MSCITNKEFVADIKSKCKAMIVKLIKKLYTELSYQQINSIKKIPIC